MQQLCEAGLGFIDPLSVDDILHSPLPRSVQCVPNCLRGLFQECCFTPLRKIEKDQNYDGRWKLLMPLPRMILRPHPRSGSSGNQEVKASYHCFLTYHWQELINLCTSCRSQAPGRITEDLNRKAALRLVKCGKLSRAARILTSNDVAPSSENAILCLRSKHPTSEADLILPPVSNSSPISLKKSIFVEWLKRSPRGSGNRLSSWQFEHLPYYLA